MSWTVFIVWYDRPSDATAEAGRSILTAATFTRLHSHITVNIHVSLSDNIILFVIHHLSSRGRGGGLVPRWEVPRMILLGFYLREAFQSQINTEKILYNKSH